MQGKKDISCLVVLYVAAFVAAFNENVINVALIDIMATFDVASTTAQWLVTGYMIVTAIVVTIVAYLSQRFSLRQLFFGASTFFIAGSLLCLVAPSYPTLLVARLIQSVGTGIFIPIMMNTVLALAPRTKLGAYLSVGSCAITLGPAFAPVVSGLMVTFFGWRSIFIPPLVIAAILVICGVRLVRNVAERRPAKLDILSVLLSAVGLTLFVYGLSLVSSDVLEALVAIGASIVVIAGFVKRQNSIESPMLDLAPLRNPRFSLACLLVIVAMMTTFSMSVLLPLYFEGALGTTALIAGALILPPIAINALTAIVGGRVMDARGTWPLLPVGFALIAIGQTVVCIVGGAMAALPVVLGAVVVYAGVGLIMSPSQTAGLKQLEREQHPHGVAIMSTTVMVASCIGPSLFVGVLSTSAARALSSGASQASSQAAGFSSAVLVAAAIAVAGLALSIFYAYETRRTKSREGAAEAAQVETSPFGAVIRNDVYSIGEDATVRDVAAALLNYRTSGLPVVDGDGHVVGFVSDGDIMRGLGKQNPVASDLAWCVASYGDDEPFDDRVAALMDMGVMELATRRVVSVGDDVSLEEVSHILSARQIKKIPVLRDGMLVGTISRSDIVRYLMEGFIKAPSEATV